MSHLGERLSALVDGELSHDQRDRVLAHLAKCEPCRREAAALRLLKRRMRALGEATAEAALTDRLMAVAAPAGSAGGGRSRPLPASGEPAAETLPRWPVRSLALSALAVLALSFPAAAFMAGGGQQEPGPSVTPAVDVYLTQHAITSGAMPAVTGGGSAASAADQTAPGAAGGHGAAPAAGPGPAGAAARSLENAIVSQSLKRAISGAGVVTRPPSRHDHSGPQARRGPQRLGSQRLAGRRLLAPRSG